MEQPIYDAANGLWYDRHGGTLTPSGTFHDRLAPIEQDAQACFR